MRHALFLFSFLAACGGTTPSDDILSLTGDAANGETLYAAQCAGCHGVDGSGTGAGPNITGEEVEDEVVDIIVNGEESMPAFGDSLSDQEIADVLAYLDASIFQ